MKTENNIKNHTVLFKCKNSSQTRIKRPKNKDCLQISEENNIKSQQSKSDISLLETTLHKNSSDDKKQVQVIIHMLVVEKNNKCIYF